MGLILYNVILTLSLPLALPVLLWISIFRAPVRRGLAERFGWITDEPVLNRGNSPRIWIHAASVGEVQAVAPFIDLIFRERSGWEVVLSVMTRTGRKTAQGRFENRVPVFYFPIDLFGATRRSLSRVRPDVILIAETELWPNFLRGASARDIPVYLINGRISNRSFPRYRRLRWLFGDRLKGIRFFGMQTTRDARRMAAIGAPPERVRITGNMKYDRSPDRLTDSERNHFLETLGWTENRIVFFGSTHAGEEELALDVYEKLSPAIRNLAVVIAPRHPKRFPDAVRLLDERGIPFVRYSELKAGRARKGYSILLLDELGSLGRLYQLGHAAFVGGTLVPVGGHNLIEPAAAGKPVFFGPHYENVREAGDLLIQADGGRMVADAGELSLALEGALGETGGWEAMGERARRALKSHRGTSWKLLEETDRAVRGVNEKKRSRLDFRSGPERWFTDRLVNSSGGVGTSTLALFLRPFSLAYGLLQGARVFCYRKGIKKSFPAPCGVISVGNLTLGGTGKTPVVMWLAGALKERKFRPAVLSRGYGRRAGGELEAAEQSAGGKASSLPPSREIGDEPSMMVRRLPGVPVVVSADRVRGARHAVGHFKADILILDDGFQHLRLRRNLNLLVLDSEQPFGNGAVFPRGNLRESRGALKRADAVILTRTEDPGGLRTLEREIRKIKRGLPVFYARDRVEGLASLDGETGEETEGVRGKSVMAVSGIGRPDRFVRMLGDLGAEVCGTAVFPDHYPFRAKDVRSIESEADRLGADRIITTEKDAVRLVDAGVSDGRWRVLRTSFTFYGPDEFLAFILKKIGKDAG